MTKATITKLIGTGLTLIASGGALFVPQPYREIVLGLSGVVLGWLHLPQPGTVKVSQ